LLVPLSGTSLQLDDMADRLRKAFISIVS
jgi:hypothetical protein